MMAETLSAESSTLHVRVRNDIRAAAKLNADKIGIPLSTLINAFLTRFAVEGKVPFEMAVPVPNAEPNDDVYQSLQELRAGGGMRCKNVTELYAAMERECR